MVYIPAFNKRFYLKFSNSLKFLVIGSAHNLKNTNEGKTRSTINFIISIV